MACLNIMHYCQRLGFMWCAEGPVALCTSRGGNHKLPLSVAIIRDFISGWTACSCYLLQAIFQHLESSRIVQKDLIAHAPARKLQSILFLTMLTTSLRIRDDHECSNCLKRIIFGVKQKRRSGNFFWWFEKGLTIMNTMIEEPPLCF